MAGRPAVVVPILQAGVLARRFCERAAFANVEAVFDRCFYLRCGDDFACIGEPDIGNGPISLLGNLGALGTLKLLAGQIALVSGRHITIGDSVRFTLNHNEPWVPSGWPVCPPADHLIVICAALASRCAIEAPQEGLARCAVYGSETSRCAPLARVARRRVAMFESWLSGMLNGGHTAVATSREAVQGLIGLGPGLTPSGDDFLIGALAALDAIGQRRVHAALARAILDALPGLTTPLSACFLRAAASGHVGERLHHAIALLVAHDVDAAIAIIAKIGHSSGWDMTAGVLTTLRIAAGRASDKPMRALPVRSFTPAPRPAWQCRPHRATGSPP